MSNNRELSQFASLITIDDSNKIIGINTSVGIGTTNPPSKVTVTNPGLNGTDVQSVLVDTTITDTNADLAFGQKINTIISGSTSATGDREQGSLYLNTVSSNTGGSTSNEHRVYSIYNSVDVSGDSDFVTGVYNDVNASHSSGTITGFYGNYNLLTSAATSTITQYYGSYNIAQPSSGSTGAITTLIGVRGRANFATGAASTATNVFGVWANLDNDAGLTQSASGIAALYYGTYDVTTGYTNPYGVYIATAVNNYFAGSVGIGITNPGSSLQVASTEGGIRLTNTTGLSGDLSSTGWLIYQRPGNSISTPNGLTFQKDSTEIITIDPTSGHIYLLNGAGIEFGTGGPSVTSTLLDDYEEGTWTPDVSDATTGGNLATGTFYGHYTKIGRIVHVTVSLTNITTTGMTGANNLHIQGLPYFMANLTGTNYAVGSVELANTTVVNSPALEIVDNTSYMRIVESTATAARDLMTVNEFTSGTADIYGSITYQTGT